MILVYLMIIFTDFVPDKMIQYNAGTYFLIVFSLTVLFSFSIMGYNTVDGIKHLIRMREVKKLHKTYMETIEKSKTIDRLRAELRLPPRTKMNLALKIDEDDEEESDYSQSSEAISEEDKVILQKAKINMKNFRKLSN